MKKTLLPLFAAICAPAFAQTAVEIGTLSNVSESLAANGGVLDAKSNYVSESFPGLKLAQTESVTCRIYSDNTYKATSASNAQSTLVRFNGNKYIDVELAETCIQGQNNGNQPSIRAAATPKPFATSTDGCWLQFSADGCQYAFTPTKTGWLYVVNKISSNKNYYVVDIKPAEDGSEGNIADGFTVCYQVAGYFPGFDAKAGYTNTPTDVVNYTIPYDGKLPFYVGKSALPWPEDIATGATYKASGVWTYTTESLKTKGQEIPVGSETKEDYTCAYKNADCTDGPYTIKAFTPTTELYYVGEETKEDGSKSPKTFTRITNKSVGAGWDGSKKAGSVKTNGLGVVAFQVQANHTYVVMARGSKMTLGGFAFSTKPMKVEVGDKPVVAEGDPAPAFEDYTWTVVNDVPTFEEPAAIKEVSIDDLDANAPIYNIQGQRVSKGFKGICIQGGKKFIVK